MRIFNPKYKEVYINSKQSEGYKNSLRWLFSKTFDFEQKFAKDIFEFNEDQLKDFFLSRNFNEDTIKVYFSMLKDYADWEIKHGHTVKKTSYYDQINKEKFAKDVSKSNKRYYHYTEIEEMAGLEYHGHDFPRLKNKQDQALIYLPFLGVIGNDISHLLSLKMSDINKEKMYIQVDKNRKIYINPKALNLIEDAAKEDIYWKYMDDEYQEFKGNNFSELVDSEYVFKKSNIGSANPDTPMANVSLRKRMVAIREYIGEKISFGVLEKSGILYLAKLIYDRDGFINGDNLKGVFDRFQINNSPQSIGNELKFIRENLPKVYGEKYNTTKKISD